MVLNAEDLSNEHQQTLVKGPKGFEQLQGNCRDNTMAETKINPLSQRD
jgi:hypothetical protein